MSMGVRVCIPSLFSQTWTSLCYSHINQKTQFENPVLEAKKKLSQETAAIQQAAAAPSQGNIAECTPLFKSSTGFINVFHGVITAEACDKEHKGSSLHVWKFANVGLLM